MLESVKQANHRAVTLNLPTYVYDMQINMYILAFTNIFITLQIASKPYTLISEQ